MGSIKIPWRSLSLSALKGVIEEYVSREGTEYGLEEVSLEEKVGEVIKQLETGDVVITFNDQNQTCSIVQSRQL